MSTSLTAILDPTATSQRQWFDALHADSAVISTTATANDGSPRPADLADDFYRALASLHRMPNLTSVALHFGPNGWGTFESRDRRHAVLRAFFDATATHARQAPRIRSLTIKNLQNDPDNEAITTSTAIRDTMKHVDALHLHVCTDSTDENPWAAPEMQIFWPHLRTSWLAPVAHQLHRLALYCDNFWGVWPRFDTTGLAFPRLKSLALGSFVFGQDEQLD